MRLAVGASLIATLAACGGGDDAGSSNGGGSAVNSTTGVAAVGAPIVGGSVELKCASGVTTSATTGSDGTWGVSLKDIDYPCSARVSGGKANGNALVSPLHTVAKVAGTANITPLTDLVVGILAGQDPATWYASATNGALSGAITSSALSGAQGKLKNALATLPGKPALPDGFDPLTSSFNAEKGDAGDDLLEGYGSALKAAGLTQTEAATHTAAGEALTQEAHAATAFTTPNLATIQVGTSRNLDGKYALSIPDPNRGALTTNVNVDADGNITGLTSDTFTGFVSLFGNRIGQLCTAGVGGFSNTQHSQYVYVSEDLTPVTDPAELYGKTFTDYEDCNSYGRAEFKTDGSFVFTETGKAPDAPDINFQEAFTANGYDDKTHGANLRAKAYKYTANGQTAYVYLVVSTKKGSTTPDLNGEVDYVLMGVSMSK